MSAVRSVVSTADAVAVLLVAGLAVAATPIVLGRTPVVAIVAAVLGVAALWYLIRRPAHLVIAMVAVEVSGVGTVLAQHRPVPLLHLSLAAGVLSLVIALRNPQIRARVNRGTALCAALLCCYLFTQVVTAFTSRDPSASFGVVVGILADGAFLLVLLLLMQITRRWWAFAAAFVVPLAVICVLCLINQVVFGGEQSFGGFAGVTLASGELVTTPRYGGPTGDSNFWGRILVLAVPLAAALAVNAARDRRGRSTWGWVGVLAALAAGIYLTQSRGTMIATCVALAVWVVASGPDARRRGVKYLPLAGLLLLIPGVGNRLFAVASSVSGPSYVIDPSVLERMAAQQSAWAMFRDAPIFGVGPHMYFPELPRYVGKVPTAVLHPTNAPHNLYAELAAQGGIVGLAGWVIFLCGFVALLVARLGRIASSSPQAERSLPAAVLAAVLGWSIASVFLHMSSFRTLAVVLALAGAWGATRGREAGSARGLMFPAMRRWAVGVAAGSCAAFGVLFLSGGTVHSASQDVAIMPTPRADMWEYDYALSIKNRNVLIPTYAHLMNGNADWFTVAADPVRGVVTVSVQGPDQTSVRPSLDAALAQAQQNIEALGADSWYRIAPSGSITVRSWESHSMRSMALAALVGTLTMLACAVRASPWGSRPSSSRRRDEHIVREAGIPC